MAKFRALSTQSYWILGSIAVGLMLLAILIHYRNDVFQSMQDPGQPFQTYERPTAPNYNLASSWMDLPDLAADSYADETIGDVFVVVPVLFKGGSHWNLPVDDDQQLSKLNAIIRPNYVGPYRSAGRVFAPFYRQASLYTAMTNREDARRAQDLAYRDVRRAFEFFLTHTPPERPIVVAGHGQGASHAQRLLADYFQGDLKNRLAAAYIIDHPLPLDKFESELSATPPCESELQTNCIVAWGAFMPGDGPIAERFSTRSNLYENGDYRMINNRPLLCVNPLIWNLSSDYAPKRLHKGGIAAVGLEPETQAAPLSKQVGTQCQDGLLYVDRPRSRVLRRPIRIGGQYRTLPSNLFYEDIRQNAELRVQTLKQDGTLPDRVEKLDDFDVIEIIDSPVTPVKED